MQVKFSFITTQTKRGVGNLVDSQKAGRFSGASQHNQVNAGSVSKVNRMLERRQKSS